MRKRERERETHSQASQRALEIGIGVGSMMARAVLDGSGCTSHTHNTSEGRSAKIVDRIQP